MIYIFLSAIGVIVTITVKPSWSQKGQILFILSSIIVSLFIFLGIDFLLEERGFIVKGPNPSFLAQIPYKEICLYFIMVSGMTAKYVYDWIGQEGKRQKKFNKWQLFKPMLVSPIVFGNVYGNIAPDTSTFLLLIFAFQNGFFWQTILNKPDLKDI